MNEEKKKWKHGIEKWSNSVLGIFWFSKKAEPEPEEDESEEENEDLCDTGEDVFHP